MSVSAIHTKSAVTEVHGGSIEQGAPLAPADAPSLLSDAGGCAYGDIGAEVERLVRKTAQTMTHVAEEMERSAQALEAKANERHVQEMRDQSLLQLAEGMTSAVVSAATAACSVASFSTQIGAANDSLAASKEVENATKNGTPNLASLRHGAEVAAQKLQLVEAVGKRTEAFGKMGESLGQIQQSALKYAAGEKGADAAASEAEARRDGAAANEAKEMRQSYEKLAERALEFYRQWCQERVATERASLRA